jgi:hypothetical protein
VAACTTPRFGDHSLQKDPRHACTTAHARRSDTLVSTPIVSQRLLSDICSSSTLNRHLIVSHRHLLFVHTKSTSVISGAAQLSPMCHDWLKVVWACHVARLARRTRCHHSRERTLRSTRTKIWRRDVSMAYFLRIKENIQRSSWNKARAQILNNRFHMIVPQ